MGGDSHGAGLVLYASNNGVRFPNRLLMRNFWLSKIDRALTYIGYDADVIAFFTEKEKERLVIDEYLYRLGEDIEDCLLSVDDMADYVIDYYRR